jgi:hypothetical protein
MTSVKCILNELNLVPEFKAKSQAVQKKKKKTSKDLMETGIKVVEVQWHDRIERVAFPAPMDAKFLTHKSKTDFIVAADLSTAEKRMKQLLAEAPVFMAEMQQIYTLSQWSSTYAFIHHK